MKEIAPKRLRMMAAIHQCTECVARHSLAESALTAKIGEYHTREIVEKLSPQETGNLKRCLKSGTLIHLGDLQAAGRAAGRRDAVSVSPDEQGASIRGSQLLKTRFWRPRSYDSLEPSFVWAGQVVLDNDCSARACAEKTQQILGRKSHSC